MERVLWPMEPVEPRMANLFNEIPSLRLHLEVLNNLSVPQHRSGQQQRVDTVQNPAMPWQQRAGILDTGRPLERRLRQIAYLRSHIDDHGQEQPMNHRARKGQRENLALGQLRRQFNQQDRRRQATDYRPDRSQPGFTWA